MTMTKSNQQTINQAFKINSNMRKILVLNDHRIQSVLEDEITRIHKNKTTKLPTGDDALLLWKKIKNKEFTQRPLTPGVHKKLQELSNRLKIKESKLCTLIIYYFAKKFY